MGPLVLPNVGEKKLVLLLLKRALYVILFFFSSLLKIGQIETRIMLGDWQNRVQRY